MDLSSRFRPLSRGLGRISSSLSSRLVTDLYWQSESQGFVRAELGAMYYSWRSMAGIEPAVLALETKLARSVYASLDTRSRAHCDT